MKDTLRRKCFEIWEENKIVGFLVMLIIDDTAYLKHIYISNSADKEKTFKEVLGIVLLKLRNDKNIISFDNLAFPFLEDYISKTFIELGYDILQRINMILDPISLDNDKSDNNYLIRQINLEDLKSLATIGSKSYKNSIDFKIDIEKRNINSYYEFLKSSYDSYLNKYYSLVLSDLQNNVLAFCLVEDAEDKEVIIQDFVVKENKQNQGIGKIILYETIKQIKERLFKRIILTVTEENLNAKKIYEDFGFSFFSRYPVITIEQQS